MSLETFRQALNFLEQSRITQARLLGGEPTLHPDFTSFMDLAIQRGFTLLIFSNGLISEQVLTSIEKAPEKHVRVLVNVAGRDEPNFVHERQRLVFKRLGNRMLPGYNIHGPALELDFLLDLIREFNLAKLVRLGLAHPCLNKENSHLHSRYYETVGGKVLTFAARARAEGVDLELDCGFVPCMFSEEGIRALGKAGKDIGRRCNPILDLLPDGRIIPCYPLFGLHSVRLAPGHEAKGLRDEFAQRLAPYRNIGIFRECSACELRKQGHCFGGCLSAAMKRLRSSARPFMAPIRSLQASYRTIHSGEDSAPSHNEKAEARREKWIIPYIDQPIVFWRLLKEDFSGHINEVYFPFPGEFGSGRPKQPDRHLHDFLKHSPFALTALINPIVLPSTLEKVAPAIIDQLRRLQGEFGLFGVTVANVQLAERIRDAFPGISITASVLMDIYRPNQAMQLNGLCDNLVPASRIMRDLASLRALRSSFSGRIRLIVNEGCLPDCLFRAQHFYEMGSGTADPRSLCEGLLEKTPWLRLTGAWVLPQHLHLYKGIYDELKLAGRITLQNPVNYRRVLNAYINRSALFPHEIGGGPASVLGAMEITKDFYSKTLACGRQCHQCAICRNYAEQADSNMQGLAKKRRISEMQ